MLIPRIVWAVKQFRDAPPSAASLIAANLWQLAGVLFLGWDILLLALVFWAENLVVGFWNFFKILLAGGMGSRPVEVAANVGARMFMACFFAFHYGMFTMVHGIFILALLGRDPLGSANSPIDIAHRLNTPWLWVGIGLLFASHAYSFFSNYVGKGEYRHTSPANEMFRVYGRIVVLHVAIIFGGILIITSGLPRLFAAVLVPLKIVLDLLAHLGERRRYALAAGRATAPSNV